MPDLFSMLEFESRINEVHANREGETTFFLVVQGGEFTLFKDALEELKKEQVQSEIEFV